MRITIGGTPGSGKSTIAQFLAEKLNIKRYYMGGIFRDLAKKRGLTTHEYCRLGQTDPTVDKEVDDYQKNLENQDNWVIEGRTSFHILPNSIKLFIKVDPKVGAERIFSDKKERNEGEFQTVEELMVKTEIRLQTDRERYQKYYDVDYLDEKNYDLVIDTTYLSLEEAKEKTLEAIEKYQNI